MPFNVGALRDQIELYCGLAGVTSDKLNPELVRTIINQKMREFAGDTGIISSKISITSVADQQEYQLPDDVLHITNVHYDSYRADKITFEQVDDFTGKVNS